MLKPLKGPQEPEVLALQRSLASLAFASDAHLMEKDPTAFAKAQGLPPKDQQAFRRFRDRLLAYRRFIRDSLAEPIEEAFPITVTLLEGAGEWEACLGAFLATRSVQSNFYRDVAPTFLGWLSATGWGQQRWHFLLELAHCEALQLLVEHHPGGPIPDGLHPLAQDQDCLVLDPTAQVVTYAFGVHLATMDQPVPGPGPVHLLVHRKQERVCWKELTPATAALLVHGQARPLLEVFQALGLPKPSGALGLLDEFCAQGILLGFKTIA